MMSLFYILLLTLIGTIANADIFDCFLRAEPHTTKSNTKSNTKSYAFTFDAVPPTLVDTLDPCLRQCLRVTSCVAVLYYTYSDGVSRCVSAITDDVVKSEMKHGRVAEIYVKRGDTQKQQCANPSSRAATKVPMSTPPPMQSFVEHGRVMTQPDATKLPTTISRTTSTTTRSQTKPTAPSTPDVPAYLYAAQNVAKEDGVGVKVDYREAATHKSKYKFKTSDHYKFPNLLSVGLQYLSGYDSTEGTPAQQSARNLGTKTHPSRSTDPTYPTKYQPTPPPPHHDLLPATGGTTNTPVPKATPDGVIAFSASTGQTMTVMTAEQSCTIVFNKILTNTGDAYNATSGAFTAPRAGIYLFTCDLQSPRGTLASARLLRNDDVIHSIWANGRNTGDRGVGSGTVVVVLAVGDQVRAKLVYESGYTFVLKDVSRFTGYKLQ